jgi:hypothetical protein
MPVTLGTKGFDAGEIVLILGNPQLIDYFFLPFPFAGLRVIPVNASFLMDCQLR